VYLAALKYRASYGVRFSNYTKRAIKNRVLREVARLSRQREDEVPLDADAGDLPMQSSEPSEHIDPVTTWTRELPEPHGTIFRLLYVEGLKQRAVAERLGKTQPWVSQMHRSLLNLARAVFQA
jgi:RNA polymerase sigma factor (sigma-70 family)